MSSVVRHIAFKEIDVMTARCQGLEEPAQEGRHPAMKIVVLVKHVPDATADRRFSDDKTTDRVGVDGILSELDEYAIEEALNVADSGDAEVVLLTMGPEQAAEAVRKGLQMGADSGVHVVDDALHGLRGHRYRGAAEQPRSVDPEHHARGVHERPTREAVLNREIEAILAPILNSARPTQTL